MGRFGLSNEDSDDDVAIYPQDGGDDTRSNVSRTSRIGNRALTTFLHPDPLRVPVADTCVRETFHHGQLLYDEHIQVRRRNDGSKKKCVYWKQCAFIVLLILMQRYLPPPPPPVASWGEYISYSTQGIKATITNLVALTIYIVTGCLRNINEDVGSAISSSLLFRQTKHSTGISDEYIPCPLKVSINSESYDASVEAIRGTLQSNVVGQHMAIDLISKALAMWNISLSEMHGSSHELDEKNKRENSNRRKRPLNMIFVGSDGVGKYEVAKQVGELLTRHECQSDGRYSPNFGYDERRILHLQGINHALNDESCAKSLIRQILSHVYRHKNEGAVIILRHVEDLSHAAKLELIRLLSKPSVSFLVEEDDVTAKVGANSNLLERFLLHEEKTLPILTRKEVVVRLDNCIFLLTTDLGTDKIFRVLRNPALESTGLVLEQVTSDIEKEIKGFLGVNFEIFDAIVPFWPLQFVAVKDIIKSNVNKRVSRYKIQLMDSALDYLAGPSNVDYMELKMTGTGDVDSFIFATRGGHDLGHEPLIRYIEEKLEDDVFHHDDEVTRIGYIGDDTWTMEQCVINTMDGKGMICVNKGPFQPTESFLMHG